MQNINEVVGIIKGISFDGVINIKEINYLKSWVDDNRHYAIIKQQKKLIKLVDEALKDNVLTNWERQNILTVAQSIVNSQNDKMSTYTELNGIIAGIISDNIINKEEVINLKEWYELNGDLIKGSDSRQCIKNLLYKIMDDGIITADEQEELLKLLMERIDFLRIETKIDYLRIQLNKKKNIGIELIDLLDKGNNMNFVHAMAESQLRQTLNSYSATIVRDPDIVLISLSLIAMLSYDGSFYDSVRETYKNIYSKFSEQKVEGLIRDILNRYKI